MTNPPPVPAAPAVAVAVERLHVPLVAWLLVAVAAFALYAISLENGALLAAGAERLHEFFHDGRHFFGVPCH